MEYKLIDKVPTSRYGVSVARKCNWCYSIIENVGMKRDFISRAWCSKDCRDEERDFRYLTAEVRRKESLRKSNEKRRRLGKVQKAGDRVAYFKKYYQKNKVKRNKQMREYMAKRKVEQLLEQKQ